MKKIIALFLFMLAFSVNANAQQKKATQAAPAKTATEAPSNAEQTIKQAALRDVALLMEVVTLSTTDKQNFFGLFEHKHRNLQEGLSDERKAILAQSIEGKIRATLNEDQMDKLSKSPALLQKLTH